MIVNLGGEGEIPNVINQQPDWVLTDPNWFCSETGQTIEELQQDGHQFIFCPNERLAFANESVMVVHTNGVQIDGMSWRGLPWVPLSEIWRILAPGGMWYFNGELRAQKLWRDSST